MQRILIIGAPGTGKSTLARIMGLRLGLPVIHLDAEYWQPGWVEPAKDTWAAKVAMLAARETWVMDGNYSGSWQLRLPRAEAVVWLDLPRRVYLTRTLVRTFGNLGRVRPDLGPDCPERFDWEFVKWVWNYRGRSRNRTIATLDRVRSDKRVVVLRSPGEVAAFIAGLPASLMGSGASLGALG
jgi:adenylate kinase family enzyme